MIIECPFCEAKVDANELCSHDQYDPEMGAFPFMVMLLKCPVCNNALLAGQDYVAVAQDKKNWSSPNRLWPSPEQNISWHIPPVVRASLEEARKCLGTKAYIACVAMCGRALEAICRHYKTKSKYIEDGLEELLEKEVIDRRLFQWGKELQKHRISNKSPSELLKGGAFQSTFQVSPTSLN